MQAKPSVAILMAIYKPNVKWLMEQLLSLNSQTYENLTLLVWNDDPEDDFDYATVYMKCITKYPYKIYKGERNLGFNGAFGQLTKLANAEYVAYCDQDDIWLPDKISILVNAISKDDALLVCSDMYVIDKNGTLIGNSIASIRPRLLWSNKAEGFKSLLIRNFVTGCTSLVKTSFAQEALPFSELYVYDWQLALYASNKNALLFINKPLIKYRIHDNNQTGVLTGVYDKLTYYQKRIKVNLLRSEWLVKHFHDSPYISEINEYLQFTNISDRYFKEKSFKNLISYLKVARLDLPTSLFEIIILSLPDTCVKFVINNFIRRSR